MDKLRAMKFFCRTVEAKSFASAAHDLDIAPSVLSKVISALEADLRFTLFNRSTRRLSLTEAGHQCETPVIRGTDPFGPQRCRPGAR
jgi:DNA-binding transcriptional LysR family regulator